MHPFSSQLNSRTGKTPLMCAAEGAGDETVAFLLSKGADPDLMENNGKTALVDAIQTSCSSNIDLLAPVTQKGLGKALACLAFDSRIIGQGCLRTRSGTCCWNGCYKLVEDIDQWLEQDNLTAIRIK